MSVPRFFLPSPEPAREGMELRLSPAQARHLWVLRLPAGAALEVVLPEGAWRADLGETLRDSATARLVGPLSEDREAPMAIEAHVPLTAQLSLVDDFLPALVEMGATRIQPIAYARSEYDVRKTAARMERWQRILEGACEQSHRSRLPRLTPPAPFEALLEVETPQRWVAHEVPSGQANPTLERAPIAFTSGPEGGITEAEYEALTQAGWKPVSLGGSILRAVTCPVALLGAIRFQLPH